MTGSYKLCLISGSFGFNKSEFCHDRDLAEKGTCSSAFLILPSISRGSWVVSGDSPDLVDTCPCAMVVCHDSVPTPHWTDAADLMLLESSSADRLTCADEAHDLHD